MEINGKVHCFFEQSGTFKNEFIKLGIPAEDYDIQNNFGETDHIVNLFSHIEREYDKTRQDKTRQDKTIFDDITKDDLIVAFFPCIYFSTNNQFLFEGTWITWKQRGTTELERNDEIIKRNDKRALFYNVLLMLFSVCVKRNLRLIVENPYSINHYLTHNFPYKPALIDLNRRLRGDSFQKPTQYWFLNAKPTNGASYQQPKQILNVEKLSGHTGNLCDEQRSMISPDYARNFICDFILGKKQDVGQLSLF